MDSFDKACPLILNYIKETLPCLIPLPLIVKSIRFLSNERDLLGITTDGHCFGFNIYLKNFHKIKLSANELNEILLYQNGALALITDPSTIFCLEVKTLNIKNKITLTSNEFVQSLFMPNENYLFSRMKNGGVFRWKTADFKNPKQIFFDEDLDFFTISEDSFVIGGLKTKIAVFSLKFEVIAEKKLGFSTKNNIVCSPLNNFLCVSHKKTLIVLYKNNLNIKDKICFTDKIAGFCFTRDEKYLLATTPSGNLVFVDTLTFQSLLTIPVFTSLSSFIHIAKDNSKICVMVGDELFLVKFPKIQQIDYYSQTPKILDYSDTIEISTKVFSPSKDLLIESSYSKTINVWNISEKKCETLIGHDDVVLSLHVINSSILASGSKDNSIKIWNYRKLLLLNTLYGHVDSITCLGSKDEILLSGSCDQTIKIWKWEDSILFHTIKFDSKIVGLYCSDKNFIVATFNSLQMWDIEGFSLVMNKFVSCDINCLIVASDGNKLIIDKKLGKCIENPCFYQNITIWGKNNYYDFLRYIQNILWNNTPEYSADMENFIILPYRINILHFYAYKNYEEHIAKDIFNKVGFFNSFESENPISLSIKQNNSDCIVSIINAYFSMNTYPLQFEILTYKDLIAINAINTKEISKLYSMIWYESFTTLPKYCDYHTSLPISLQTDSKFIYSTKFIPLYNENTGLEIRYFTSLLSLPIEIGTQDSILLIESIVQANPYIFSADIIKKLIFYKWNNIKWFIGIEAVWYLLYFVFLIESIAYSNSQASLIQTNVLSSVISLWMIYKIFATKHLTGWHIFDIFRLLLMILYTVENLSNTPYEIEYVFILVALLSAVQGLYYFSIFSKTRLIAYKIIEAFTKLISFISVIVYLLGTLALVLAESNYVLEIENPEWKTMNSAFTCVVWLMMLCFLLSIKSKKTDKHQNLKELASIICCYEKVLVWKRSKKSAKFFQQCCQSVNKKISNKKKFFKNTENWKNDFFMIDDKLKSIENQFERLEKLVKKL